MKHLRPISIALFAVPLLVGAGIAPSQAQPPPAQPHRPPEQPSTISVYVALEGRSVAQALRQAGATTAEQRREIAQRQLAYLSQRHSDVRREVENLGGVVEADFKRLANALQVRIAPDRWSRLEALPGVTRVELVPIHERALASAVPYVGANRLWNAPGIAATGKGVRIGIVDTGIDYLHAHLGGSGDPLDYKNNDRTIIEPDSFPTTKVIGGRDFVGDDYTGDNGIKPDPDPLDCSREQEQYIAGGHGSHVAGIAAGTGVSIDGAPYQGPYEASLDPSQFKISPGVAPEASLYALKVFGCDGGTTMVAAAMEWAVDPDQDGDFSDRLDVVNMSLGGAYGLETSTDAEIVRSLTEAGTLLVVAAGNDGNTFFVTGEPATHTETLSVAASTDQTSFLSMRVDSPASVAGEIPCVEGSFTKPLAEVGTLGGVLQATVPARACSDLSNAAALAGKVALIDRGDCYFVDKIRRAAEAGALAAVVVNNSGDPPFSMGGDGTQGAIPAVMVSLADGDTLRSAQEVAVTLDPANIVQNDDDADQVAGFSSRGPRASDGALKPDIAAPGVAIDSAGVASGNQPRQNQGTSMACPMVAGGAALLREAHPDRPPMTIKTMLMNTTASMADALGNPTPVSLGGAGRMRVDAAAQRDVIAAAAEPAGAVSVSFGHIVTFEPASRTRDVVISNLGAATKTFEASVTPTYALPGATVSITPQSISVPAGETKTVTVTIEVEPAALPFEQPDPHTPASIELWGGTSYPRHFVTEAAGHIVFQEPGSDAGDALRVPYHAIVRAADQRLATPSRRCKTEGNDLLQIPIEGPITHKEPLTSAFQLAITHPEDFLATGPQKQSDLLAVGVATNTATAESFADASVYFALVVAGQWSTPARGPLSIVGIAIDTNEDGVEDYIAYTEPLAREFFADVLTVTTYKLNTGEAVSRRFLNLFQRDTLNTEPFHNSVVVLPVSLQGLNLTDQDASFRFRGFTHFNSPYVRFNTTEWTDYDPTKAPIDTTVAGLEGSPFYPAPLPVSVRVNATDESVPDVLLLHHTNARGKRHEIVSLSTFEGVDPTDLVLEQQLPESVGSGRQTSLLWRVENAGATTAYDVTVQGRVLGIERVDEANAEVGSCVVGTDVRCALGDIEPGTTATITVSLTAGQATLVVDAEAADGIACESAPANNAVSGTIKVLAVPDAGADEPEPLSVDGFDPGGGCSCRLASDGARRGLGGWALIGLGLALLRRRERR
jgi:MYXO-CTERM domain-containing protein